MNPFGILLLIYLIYFFIRRRNYNVKKVWIEIFIVACFIKLNIGMGYFIKLGNYEVLYDEVMTAVLFVLSIIVIFKYRENKSKQVILYSLFFLISAILSLFFCWAIPLDIPTFSDLSLWDPYVLGQIQKEYITINPYSFIIFIRLLLFCIIAIAFQKVVGKLEFKKIVIILAKLSSIMFMFWIIESIFSLIESDAFRIFANKFFGVASASYTSIFQRSGIIVLYGFMKEPSQLNLCLFQNIIIIYAFIKYSNNKTFSYIKIISCLILLLLVSAMSSILYILAFMFILLIDYLFNKKINKTQKIIFMSFVLLASLIMGISLYNKYEDRILVALSIVFNGEQELIDGHVSEFARLLSIQNAFTIFFKRPLFGIGTGITSAHTMIPVVLADFGLVGSILLFLTYKSLIKHKMTIPNLLKLIGLIIIFSIIGEIGQIYHEISVVIYICLFNRINKYSVNKKEIVENMQNIEI